MAPQLDLSDPISCVVVENKKQSRKDLENTNMVVEHKQVKAEVEALNKEMENPVGKNLRTVLEKAQSESRVVVGLSAAVKHLSVAPEESLFCVLAPPKKGDSATHMHEVLLQAFCFENDIYIIQVDSAEKLGRLLNVNSFEACVLVQKSHLQGSTEEFISQAEDAMIDYCEEYWDAPKQPIVQLPGT